jgi:hypothetical protein
MVPSSCVLRESVDDTIGQRFDASVCIATSIDTIAPTSIAALSFDEGVCDTPYICVSTMTALSLDEGVCDTPLHLCVRCAALSPHL